MSDGNGARPQRDGHGEHRTFGLTTFSVRNRMSVLVLLAIVVILGFISYRTIPKEANPEITIPMIAISTVYSGVAPKDVETLVTRVIEEELNGVADIRELTSTSVEGYSNVIAEFEPDMDMDAALQKVREKVDLARPQLPADAEEPSVMEFNVSEFPIMQVNVSGRYDVVRLKQVAEDMQERLEQIPSILEVRLSGGLEREVGVDVDLARLKYYDLAYSDVVDAIRSENVNVPGGSIEVGTQEYLVRVSGEFDDPAVIEDIVVTTRAGRPIYVRDVANVDFGFRERESFARLDGVPVVTLDIVKRSGENIIETAEAVKSAIEEMEPSLPPTTVVRVTSDQSTFIEDMVANLENNIISGLLLVLAVLLFFLGVRNALFVAISIPLSMLLSFIVLKAMAISMNMIVLFSLILALGMLVDNAIVVVENIYRYMEEGYERMRAAILGTGEVAVPIIASTLTTLGAFFPLVFWPGIVGEFMGYLPRTLIVTLSSSLFVALVIVPVLCAMFMKLDGTPSRPPTPAARYTLIAGAAFALVLVALANPLTAVLFAATAALLYGLHRFVLERAGRWFQNRALPWMVAAYERRLRWSLDHRGAILGGTMALFVAAIVVFGAMGTGVEFFPESIPPQTVYASLDVPSGTRVEFTNEATKQLEAQLEGIPGMQDAETVVTTVGASSGGMFSSGGDATITVSFRDFEERESSTFETLRHMQEQLGAGVAGADVSVEEQGMGPPSGAPISVEIVGEDPETLRRLGDRAVEILRAEPVGRRLDGLESDMSRGRPELVVDVDRERAALYGLSTASVGNTIRSAIQGTEAATYRAGSEEYDIIVRLAEQYRSDLGALENLTVVSRDGVQVPLVAVADWHVEEGFSTVRRKDLDRVVTLTSDVRAGENSNAVRQEVKAALAEFAGELPSGYTIRYTGEQQDQQEAQEFLGGAFLIALLLIGFILVSQFNSVIKPIIILTSVVMSTIGVLVGLIIFRMPFGIIMTGVGIISLAGVVVNNAIVLIDYIDILRDRDGMNRREALVRGGMTRFRPVVLTAVTTVLGLVPLAIGLNFDFLGLYTRFDPNLFWGGEQAAWWGPMAIAVIAGLTFATFLTLVVVPVLYSLVDDAAEFFRRHYTRSDELDPSADPARAAASIATGSRLRPQPVGSAAAD